MRLDPEQCWTRLAAAGHGVLATVHATRGVDVVPVVFAVDGDRLVVPVDTVKAKTSTRLQRVANLDADPRCAVLADHYDDDWSRLWWVRAHGSGALAADPGPHLGALAERFPAYRRPGAVVAAVVVTVREITGWAEA